MVASNFEKSLDAVLLHEGGYVNDPRDSGGETNMGISRRSYPQENIKGMTRKRAGEIYRRDYWNSVRGDELPSGLDYVMFDAAAHSGPSRAIKWLQAAAGVPQDGVFGAVTQTAVAKHDPGDLVRKVCANRLAFMRRLGTWPVYGVGWARRVDGVQDMALDMVDDVSQLRQDWLQELIEALLGLFKK